MSQTIILEHNYLMTRLRIFAEFCFLRLKKPSHVVVHAIITSHAGARSAEASKKISLWLLMHQILKGLLKPSCRNLTRRDVGNGTRLYDPSIYPLGLQLQGMEHYKNNLTGHSAHLPREVLFYLMLLLFSW